MKYLFMLIFIAFTLAVANAQDTLTVAGTDTSHGTRAYKVIDFPKNFATRYYAQKWGGKSRRTFMLSNFNQNTFTPQLHLPAVPSESDINNIIFGGRSTNIFMPSNLPLNSNPFSAENSRYNHGYTLAERLFYSLVK